MSNPWQPVVAAVLASMLAVACGGGEGSNGDGEATPAGSATSRPTVATTSTTTTTTTTPPIEGVETFSVVAGHRDGPLTYPNVPPVGGIHNPAWSPCAFYDRPVPNEMAVHSLEHGAIWVTYRPDLAQDQVDALAALARSRKDVLVSRWDDGLPSPLVATGWGRQLRLTTAADPRLAEFVRAYANRGPEPNAPC